MRNRAYWERRAAARMVHYMEGAENTATEISKAYQASMRYITEEAEKILRTFQSHYGLTEAEARLLLKHAKGRTAPDRLKGVLERVRDPEKRDKIRAAMDAPAYKWRIGRLEALQGDIDRRCRELYGVEQKAVTGHLKGLCGEAYSRTMFDIQKGTGLGFSFSQMPASRIDEILKNPWSGEDYSARIWGHVSDMGAQLKEEMLVSFMTGRSTEKSAQAVAGRFGAGAADARRLVRTESGYIANQAEMDSYRECGIDRYEFLATLDSRTSPVCQALDGKVFPVAEGKAGVNMPPMHPYCRSTTVAVIDGVSLEGMKRRARDPETGEIRLVPADMTYAEWKKGFVVQESDFGDAVRRAGKSVLSGGRVVGFDGLPKGFQEAFRDGLSNAAPEAKRLLRQQYRKADYRLVPGKRSYYRQLGSVVGLGRNAVPSTLAHELFHRIDAGGKISKGLSEALEKDYAALAAASGGDVKGYLMRLYPMAFEIRGLAENQVFRSGYRGISDILNGLSSGKIRYGYGHEPGYWKQKGALSSEAWAQFGRILYENDREVMKMLYGIFPNFKESAILALKEVI